MTVPDALRIEEYFAGRTTAFGVVEDRFGRIRRRFTVAMQGRPEGADFVLEEHFVFDDGEETDRVWRVRADGPAAYTGRAGDVVGIARGRVDGPTLSWAYRLRLPVGGRHWTVAFDDRMYLGAGGLLLNIARMRKWGLTIGRIIIAFTRDAPVSAARDGAGEDRAHTAKAAGA